MKAIDSGINAAAVVPATSRATPRVASEPAKPATPTVSTDASVINVTTRNLPNRSPSGPHRSWHVP